MTDFAVQSWEPQQRRVGGFVAMGVAVALTAVGVIAWAVAGDIPWLSWTLVGLLGLDLVFIIALLVLGAKAEPLVDDGPHAGPAAPASMMAEPEPPASAPQVKMITLRCGDCGTVFDIEDTGARPLYHSCPGCGAEGVLKDAAATAAPAPSPAPVPPPAPTQTALERPPVVSPSTTPAPRRLKLRCGGCKEVFVIEDSGERPLRRPCPYCGRMGEIR